MFYGSNPVQTSSQLVKLTAFCSTSNGSSAVSEDVSPSSSQSGAVGGGVDGELFIMLLGMGGVPFNILKKGVHF